MKIVNITKDRNGISAQVIWEDSRKTARKIYFSTDPEYGADLAITPHAFLTAAICPAFFAGEKRVLVEGAVCPKLRTNLITAVQILARWYAPDRAEGIAIEATEGFKPALPPSSGRTGMFLSGGVDSLEMLRRNRSDLPLDHPLSIRDAFFVYGFDIGNPGQSERPLFYQRAQEKLKSLTDETGVTLIPVRTNLRILEKGCCSWPDHFCGLGVASVAHAFEGRIANIFIASSFNIRNLAPCGSHPMLDTYFSSGGLRFIHDGAHLSRLEKIGIVSEWDQALQVLRVCWQDISESGPLNCGRCRKCVRVMMGLLAFGKLDQAPTFAKSTVTPAMLKVCAIDTHTVRFYRELSEPLKNIGRSDIADVVEKKMEKFDSRNKRGSLCGKIRGLFSGRS